MAIGKMVVIEIQKAEFPTDIMLFRKYLGQICASDENAMPGKDGQKRALPIVSTYFLGKSLPQVDAPVTRVIRSYHDAATGEIIRVKDDFIESFTHDSIVVQIPRLKDRRRNDLEILLSIFDQTRRAGGTHELEMDENELPEKYRDVLRRLVWAMDRSRR